nr:39S ribosomal protein L21, mitochondrial isoform X1 [Columba livia]
MSSSRDSSESPSCADRAVLCWAVQEHRPSRASPICGPGWFWAAPTFCAGPGTWPETLELWTGRRTSCWVPASPPGAGKALPVARGRPNCTVPAGAAAGSAGREEEEEDEEEAEQVARGWWGGDILPESPALGAGREGRAEPSISQQGGARPFPHSAPRGAQTTGVWEGRKDLVRVEATVIEKTESWPKINMRFRKRHNYQKKKIIVHPQTVLRINTIEIFPCLS